MAPYGSIWFSFEAQIDLKFGRYVVRSGTLGGVATFLIYVIIAPEMHSIFDGLDSDDKGKVEELKSKLHDQLSSTKDVRIVNGICDHFMSKNSPAAVDVLVNVREPHDKHLLDRLCDGIKSKNKLPAITLFGHIVRKRPIWLYKIAQHPVLKELLKLLKTEVDALSVISGLIIVNILLPLIPALFGSYLQDIFEIFSRLACWNTNNPNKLPEGHLLHLQLVLFALFHRLYGMFPCHFLSYLRREYSLINNLLIFNHTIKPMLATVRLNPLLITISKDYEVSASRWKKQEHHEIVMSCAKLLATPNVHPELLKDDNVDIKGAEFNCDSLLGTPQYTGSISRNETVLWNKKSIDNSSATSFSYSGRYSSAPSSVPQTPIPQSYRNSPYLYPEGSSPPEAAVEATPETTPIKIDAKITSPPDLEIASSAKRSLMCFVGNKDKCPVTVSPIPEHHCRPSSTGVQRSPFKSPSTSCVGVPSEGLRLRRLSMMMMDRSQIELDEMSIRSRSVSTSERIPIARNSNFGRGVSGSTHFAIAHQSFTNGVDNAPSASPVLANSVDKEVSNYMTSQRGSTNGHSELSTRYCDSVLQDIAPQNVVTSDSSDEREDVDVDISGSPSVSNGYYRSDRGCGVKSFADHRQRHDDCSSADNSSVQELDSSLKRELCPDKQRKHSALEIRKSSSCPDIKQVSEKRRKEKSARGGNVVGDSGGVKSRNKKSGVRSQVSNLFGKWRNRSKPAVEYCTNQTQTDGGSQHPHEQWFSDIFPPILNMDEHGKSAVDKRIFDMEGGHWKYMNTPSVLLRDYSESIIRPDVYADQAARLKSKSSDSADADTKQLTEQLTLMNFQLQFEEYRREVYMEYNKQLLSKLQNTTALEEYNTSLRGQISNLQRELENSTAALAKCHSESKTQTDLLNNSVRYWQDQAAHAQKCNTNLEDQCTLLEQQLKDEVTKSRNMTKALREVEELSLSTSNELKYAQQEAANSKIYAQKVELLQKELLKAGEMLTNYRQYICDFRSASTSNDTEFQMALEAYKKQLSEMENKLIKKATECSALKSHCTSLEERTKDLENALRQQKSAAEVVQNKHTEDLKIWKEKYESMKASYSREVDIVYDLQHKLAIAKAVNKRHSIAFAQRRRDEEDGALGTPPPTPNADIASAPQSPFNSASQD